MKVATQNFKKGMELAVAETGREVSCLVTDAFFLFAKEIADKSGVPWIPFYTSGAISLSPHVYTDLIREKLGVGGNFSFFYLLLPIAIVELQTVSVIARPRPI